MTAKLKTQPIKLSEIIVDRENVMGRQEINETTVYAYAETYSDALENGTSVMPPLTVFDTEEGYVLADGFHRYQALVNIKQIFADCEVKKGTKRDAILFAIRANSAHGLHRTNADKRVCTLRLINDPEWSTWSNPIIAEKAGVVESFVRKLKKEIEERNEVEQRRRINAAKALGMPLEDLEKYESPKRDADLVQYFNPKTGKSSWMKKKTVETKEAPSEKRIYTIQKHLVEYCLAKAHKELTNVENTNAALDKFIAQVKANLSQISKGNNPFSDLSNVIADAPEAEMMDEVFEQGFQDSVENN